MLRPDKKDPFKQMVYHRKAKRPQDYDDENYKYYDIETRKHTTIRKEDMQVAANTLPLECQRFLLEAKETRRLLTHEEDSKLLKLCSLTLSVWKGDPAGKLPYVSMEEYRNEFYIQMIKYLTYDGKSRYNPERAKWPAYVKWIRLATMDSIMKAYTQQANMINAAIIELRDLERESRTAEELWDEIMSYAPDNLKKKKKKEEEQK